jgi:hypothetical protein
MLWILPLLKLGSKALQTGCHASMERWLMRTALCPSACMQDAWALLQPSPAAAALLQAEGSGDADELGHNSTGRRGCAGGAGGALGRGKGRAGRGR